MKLAFLAHTDDDPALRAMRNRYGNVAIGQADIIICLGGDGFMLETLHKTQDLPVPIYGMNRGTVGFLMNEYIETDLYARLAAAEEAVIHPLEMCAETLDGEVVTALAINEVSVFRMGPQAAQLRILVDGRERMAELVCDGALVATPAGSTAYNYSAHGPIIPIGADILAITAMAAYRPRRWRGALIPMKAKVRFEVLNPKKRPVSAVADSAETPNISAVEISASRDIKHRLLFDPGHGLEERLIREQFT